MVAEIPTWIRAKRTKSLKRFAVWELIAAEWNQNQIGDETGASKETEAKLRAELQEPPGPPLIDALQQIRSIDDDLCVIAMTGLPSVEMAVATMKHQAFHYLQKPLDEDELRLVLKEAIREKGLLVDLETRLNLEVGKRIREQRHSHPLTLKQLANRTGLSVSLISQIELGKSAASMSTLHKLAAALGVRMTYFFESV